MDMDSWHESHELLLCTLCDESQIRSTLHMQQHLSYRRRNQWYTLPVVVLSVVSGSGNFISEGYDALVKRYMILTIGVLSICTSIISAISHHLGLAELSESNRVASLFWGKFYTKMKFQISLTRSDRDPRHDFMVSVFAEYDRLFEISPILIDKFLKKVKSKLKKRTFDNGFVLPYYMNGMQHTNTYGEGYEGDDEKN